MHGSPVRIPFLHYRKLFVSQKIINLSAIFQSHDVHAVNLQLIRPFSEMFTPNINFIKIKSHHHERSYHHWNDDVNLQTHENKKLEEKKKKRKIWKYNDRKKKSAVYQVKAFDWKVNNRRTRAYCRSLCGALLFANILIMIFITHQLSTIFKNALSISLYCQEINKKSFIENFNV